MSENAITPTRAQDYPEWYQSVIKAADLAENSPVRGCMVIKPWGYALWENMQAELDKKFKETGHVNAYFPLLIPLSFLEKEAEHVEGFAKECAVVTHHRLKTDCNGKLCPDPESFLDEPHIIRPTSETIIGYMYAKWVQSYRDLPILMNQWCNVMRWEMRNRIFLRTSEFLWQEGHTAHASEKEAKEETLRMLDVYAEFAEEFMAMPVIKGTKTSDERFPGALETYTIEAMMQDKKAIQAGTSHFLGQNFAIASDIKFQNKVGQLEYAWTTSWGVSTRLIGGLIMTHSDDDGLVLPPKIAPLHIIIIPIYKNDSERNSVLMHANKLAKDLRLQTFCNKNILVKVDERELRFGEKSWQAIKMGIPLRVEIGPRDIAKNVILLGRRDKAPKEKSSLNMSELIKNSSDILLEIQKNLFQKAKKFRDNNIKFIKSLDEFEQFFSDDESSMASGGGFALVHWHENSIGTEILKKLKVTARCIPFDNNSESGICIFSGKSTNIKVLFAKSY